MRASKAALALAVASVLAGPTAVAESAPQARGSAAPTPDGQSAYSFFDFLGARICLGTGFAPTHCDIVLPPDPRLAPEPGPAAQVSTTSAQQPAQGLVTELWQKLAAIGRRVRDLARAANQAATGPDASKRS
jgi:hypothetical protein